MAASWSIPNTSPAATLSFESVIVDAARSLSRDITESIQLVLVDPRSSLGAIAAAFSFAACATREAASSTAADNVGVSASYVLAAQGVNDRIHS